MSQRGDRLRPTVDAILRRPPVERLSLRLAACRGRGIALLWHRIGPKGPQKHEVVPTLPTDVFARQLDVLAHLGDIVPLAELERPGRCHRPRFALTFDDDDPGHAHHTLPLLRERGLTATFFLSGRWIHGYGPYWWEVLEASVRDEGLASVAARHGLPECIDVGALANALTGTGVAAELEEQGRRGAPTMTTAEVTALVAEGMEIGFHTVDHPVLPRLGDDAVRGAVQRGRKELAQHVGVPIRRFAYPHGRVDERATRAVADCGYVSAWTTRKRAVAAGRGSMVNGRWDAGRLTPEQLRAALVRVLVRPSA